MYILILLFLFSSAYGAGEFSIMRHPSSLVFKGHDSLKESTLVEVFSAALGFSTEHFSYWQGFYIVNPFNIPEAIVTVAVDGVKDIGLNKGHHFPLVTNDDEGHVYRSLSKRITERYPNEEPILVRIDLSNGLDDINQYSFFKGIKTEKNPKHVAHKHLKFDVEEDRDFLRDISLLNEISEKIEEGVVRRDHVPDVYWIRSSSLHALTDLHGPNSTRTKEAGRLLRDAVVRLADAFAAAYGDRALVNVIASDASHTRLRRNVLAADEEQQPSDKTKYNLASKYGKDFPAIFNIILWLCVAMFFSILAICIATATMDPGRDSIIYRMTSTRMKKDN